MQVLECGSPALLVRTGRRSPPWACYQELNRPRYDRQTCADDPDIYTSWKSSSLIQAVRRPILHIVSLLKSNASMIQPRNEIMPSTYRSNIRRLEYMLLRRMTGANPKCATVSRLAIGILAWELSGGSSFCFLSRTRGRWLCQILQCEDSCRPPSIYPKISAACLYLPGGKYHDSMSSSSSHSISACLPVALARGQQW
jgi:hypothetical protein